MFAFLEFYTATDCDICMSMDGIILDGIPLKIRRPKDYMPPAEPSKKYHIPGIISTHVENDFNKVFLGNIPVNLSDDDVKAFVGTFGPLKAFNLVKDLATGQSKGYSFFAYQDPSVTEEACKGLNGINLGGKDVVCQRANANMSPEELKAYNTAQASGITGPVYNLDALSPDLSMFFIPSSAMPPLKSRVLVLQNLVTTQELQKEYNEILDDVKAECGKFGTIVSAQGYNNRVFIEYGDENQCMLAHSSLSGRKFNNRTVITTLISEQDYKDKKLA